jgi:hypothetical protein
MRGVGTRAQGPVGPTARGRPSKKAALSFRDGLIIALLTIAPMRRGNLASLTLGRHLVIGGRIWSILLGADETKGKEELEYLLSDKVSRALDRMFVVFALTSWIVFAISAEWPMTWRSRSACGKYRRNLSNSCRCLGSAAKRCPRPKLHVLNRYPVRQAVALFNLAIRSPFSRIAERSS